MARVFSLFCFVCTFTSSANQFWGWNGVCTFLATGTYQGEGEGTTCPGGVDIPGDTFESPFPLL